MNDENACTLSHVTKRYGTRLALHDLTLEVPRGRLIGVLGSNGSGKSTLFRTLMGITRPDKGSVAVLGSTPGWRTNAQIAYLPDRARWYPHHTVHDALQWGEGLLPGFDHPYALEWVQRMRLDLHQPVAGLSRGGEARLMLILCIARRVPLLILDEPLSGIDLPSRERIMESLVERASDEDTTVLLSTHEISDAESLFDYAVFLHNGRVAQSGDTDALRTQYGSMNQMMRLIADEEVPPS